MSQVIQFICLRTQNVLADYNKFKKIPEEILNGTISLEDLVECRPSLSKEEIKILKELKEEVTEYFRNNIDVIKRELRHDYSYVISHFETLKPEYKFSYVMEKYRPDINPVTALCYEIRRVGRKFNPDNLYHAWLNDLVHDYATNSSIIGALKLDIFNLKKILNQYGILINVSGTIPLELFHAKQTISEFEAHIKELSKVSIDEHL